MRLVRLGCDIANKLATTSFLNINVRTKNQCDGVIFFQRGQELKYVKLFLSNPADQNTPLIEKNHQEAGFTDYPPVSIRLSARLNPSAPCRLLAAEHKDHAVPSTKLQDIILTKELVLKSNAIGGATSGQIRNELKTGLPLRPSYDRGRAAV